MNSIEISELSDAADAAAWSAFVAASPNASLYHGLQWRQILQASFPHRSVYLMARQAGCVCGILPLFDVRSWLFGRFMTSLPFVNYGGIVSTSREAACALIRQAERMAERSGARHVELRQCQALGPDEAPEWAVRHHKASLVVALSPGADVLWTKLSSRLRGKVRKAEKSDCSFVVGGPELVADFYRVYARNMRDLGTPVLRRTFFDNVVQHSTGARVLIVHREDAPVAAAVALIHDDRIELPWICSDYTQTKYYVNEYLYWRSIDWGCRAERREIDLGRSSIGAGTYKFKMQWNPEVRPLYWYYWLHDGAPLPQHNPDNPRFAMAIRVWKKLPLAIANTAGPVIAGNIP